MFSEKQYPIRGQSHQLSAMSGGAFAINREYFFELGGFDKGLLTMSGENFDLSLKLHLCGGNLIKVPCSVVGRK